MHRQKLTDRLDLDDDRARRHQVGIVLPYCVAQMGHLVGHVGLYPNTVDLELIVERIMITGL